MAKVTVDNLAETIQKILDESGEDITKLTKETVKKVAQKGAQALKSSSGVFGGTGKYAKGWTSKVEEGRLYTTATLHNSKVPGLPHLLEYGHAKRGGGRVSGRVHIAPVEAELEKTFEQYMEGGLK